MTAGLKCRARPRLLGAGMRLCDCASARAGDLERFPLLQYDTGGYLARWFEGTWCRAARRSTACSSRRRAAADFWPVLVVAGRADGLGARAGAARPWASAAGRCCCSASSPRCRSSPPALAHRASCSPTFSPASPCWRCYLLVLRATTRCARCERIALVALIAFAVATHSATFAVLLALVVAAALWLR